MADLDLQNERQQVVSRSSKKLKKQKSDEILDKIDDWDEGSVEEDSTQTSSDTSTQSTSQSSDELNELFYGFIKKLFNLLKPLIYFHSSDILFEDENQEIPGEGPLKTLLETKKITEEQKMSICQLIIKHSIKILKSKTKTFETYPFLCE